MTWQEPNGIQSTRSAIFFGGQRATIAAVVPMVPTSPWYAGLAKSSRMLAITVPSVTRGGRR